jgi:hypothetical protein
MSTVKSGCSRGLCLLGNRFRQIRSCYLSCKGGARIMNSSTHSNRVSNSKGKWSRPGVIHTTLYDLFAAINAEVGADEDDLAIAVVVHLLATHRLTYLGTSKPRWLVTDERPLRPRRRKAAGSRAAHAGRCLAGHSIERACDANALYSRHSWGINLW